MGRSRGSEMIVQYRESFIEAGVKTGKFKRTELGLEKRCTTCREYWPADSTFFGIKDGRLDPNCRACLAEKTMIRRSKVSRTLEHSSAAI